MGRPRHDLPSVCNSAPPAGSKTPKKNPCASTWSKAQSHRNGPGTVGAGVLIESGSRVVAKESTDAHGQAPVNVRQAEIPGPVADPEKIMQIVIARPGGRRKPLGQRPSSGGLVGERRSFLGEPQLRISSAVRLIRHARRNQVQVSDGGRYFIVVVIRGTRIVQIGIVRVCPLHREVLAKRANDSRI